MTFSLSERRLIQQNVRYNKRTAAANAKLQAQQHRDALGVETDRKTAQQAQQAQSHLSGAQAVAANSAAGFNTSFTPDQQGSIDPKTGAVLQQQSQTGNYQVSGQGEIQQAAINRLRESGMTDEQIRTQLATVQPQAQSTMSNTGQQGSFDANGMFIPGSQGTTPVDGNSIEYRRNDIMNRSDIPGADKAAMLAALAQEESANAERDRANAQGNREKGAASAASSAAADAAGQTNPTTSGGAAALAKLPPEYQALAPFFQNLLDTIQQGQTDSAAATQAMLNGGTIDVNGQQVQVEGIGSGYDKFDKKLADMEAGQVKMQQAIETMLQNTKEQSDKYINEQEKAADERAALNELKMTRQAQKEMRRAVESKIAGLALRNGLGSDAGALDIDATEMEYESRIDDIKIEFGVQATERVAQFTGLHVQATNAYTTASIQNIKDTATALERIGGQRGANDIAKGAAKQTVLGNFVTQNAANKTAYAAALKEAALQMQSMIHQSKADKRAEETEAWGRLEWLKTTFPAGSVPEDMIKGLSEKLPGVDVRGLLSTATMAEVKAKKGSSTGGSGGISFDAYMKKSDGSPPSFEDFVAEKETEALRSGAAKFDSSKAAMDLYKKEYDIRLKESQRLAPKTILTRMEDRIKNITEKNVRENIESTVNRYLSEGRFDQADSYVDGLGKTMSAEERKSFSKAAGAKQNVQRVADLIDDIGQIGPFIGQIRQLNPYDDRIVEFDNLVTQTVPGLARGIFGEVGVLTDQDVKTYTKTMANPTLTADQARTATRNLLQTIELSIQNQVDLARAAGVNTRDVGSYFGVESRDTIIDPLAGASTLDASRSYAQSLLLVP